MPNTTSNKRSSLSPLRLAAAALLAGLMFAAMPGRAQVTPTASPSPEITPRGPLMKPPVARDLAAGGLLMNYENVDLKVLARIMSEITGRQILIDDGVNGKVTVLSSREVTPDEAFEIFKLALARAGFALRAHPTFLQVVPAPEARRDSTIYHSQLRNDESVVALVLREGDATQLLAAIRPLLTDPSQATAYTPGRAIVISDRTETIQRIISLVRRLDRATAHSHARVFFLTYAEAEKLAPILQGVLTRATQNNPSEQPIKIVAFPPTNSLVVQGTDAQIREVDKILDRVDVLRAAPLTVQKPRYFVYRLQNGSSDDIAKILSDILAERKAQLQLEQQNDPTRLGHTAAPANNPGGNSTLPSPPPTTSGDTTSSNSTALDRIPFVSARVSSDPETNSIIIFVSPSEYTPIRGMLEKLDRPRRQVLVHAVVAEVSLTHLLQTGANLQAITPNGTVLSYNGGLTQAGLLSLLSGGSFALGALGSATRNVTIDGTVTSVPALFAFLTGNKTNNDVNILSAPRLVTADHQKATIKVGNVVPFPTGTSFSANGQPTVTYDYKDVGIKLELTPHMSQSDTIRLELVQEVQEVTSYQSQTVGSTSYSVPLISNRHVETDVAVKDGETLLIGGLISKRTTDTINKVPILGDIPIIQHFFRTVNKEDDKTTLFISVTPYVVNNQSDIARADRAFELAVHGEPLPNEAEGENRSTVDPRHVVADPYPQEAMSAGPANLDLSELSLLGPDGRDDLRQPRVLVTNADTRGPVEIVLYGTVKRPDGRVDTYSSTTLRFNAGQTREILLPPYRFPGTAGVYEFDLQAVSQNKVVARLPVPKRVKF